MTLRTIPPAAAPVTLSDLAHGFRGMADSTRRERLERELGEFFGAGHVLLVSSGKAALFLILSALKKLSGKRKVVIPSYTCFTVPSAVERAGLRIVPCDVRPETMDFDFGQLERLLDDDTLCVVPTHLFGSPSDIDRVRELCGNSGIFIVEDAAQAMGARHRGKNLGTLGDVSFFSLGRGKNLTCGSGGVILTSSPPIAEALRESFREVGEEPAAAYLKDILETVFLSIFLRPGLYWFPKAMPFLGLGRTVFHRDFPVWRFTGFKAGLLHDWREKLYRFNAARSGASDFYMESFGLGNGKSFHRKGFPYNRFPLLLDGQASKEALSRKGDRAGISPMYPSPVEGIPELAGTFGSRRSEGAERISATLVTLPTHILMKVSDRARVRGMVDNGTPKDKRIGQGETR